LPGRRGRVQNKKRLRTRTRVPTMLKRSLTYRDISILRDISLLTNVPMHIPKDVGLLIYVPEMFTQLLTLQEYSQ